MSYSQQMDEVALGAALSLTSLADIVTKVFFRPTQIMYVGLRITTAPTVTIPIVNAYWRPTQGSDTGRVLLKSLTRAIATLPVGAWLWGKCDPSGNHIRPGGDFILEVAQVSTAGAADAFVLVSPSWEQFDNISVMVETTG